MWLGITMRQVSACFEIARWLLGSYIAGLLAILSPRIWGLNHGTESVAQLPRVGAVTNISPPWLAAEHTGQAARELASSPPPSPPPAKVSVPTPRVMLPMSHGFTETAPWEFDGCQRREEVLDHDHHPPRVVRCVGWQRCMRCGKPFWSEGVIWLRLCSGAVGDCRGDESRFN